MKVIRTKHTIVAFSIFSWEEYANIMPTSRNLKQSRNFQDIIRANYRNSTEFCHVTPSYGFRLASLRKYFKINSTEISSEILANYYYFSICDNTICY